VLYAILCYNSEDGLDWSKEKDDDVMEKLQVVQRKLRQKGKLGPVARLHGTSSARTLRKQREPYFITDGPFAEAKEQILGFYVVDCDNENEAMDIARDLGEANPGGAFEVRPLLYFDPGSGVTAETTPRGAMPRSL
jgi:hypothetical protein